MTRRESGNNFGVISSFPSLWLRADGTRENEKENKITKHARIILAPTVWSRLSCLVNTGPERGIMYLVIIMLAALERGVLYVLVRQLLPDVPDCVLRNILNRVQRTARALIRGISNSSFLVYFTVIYRQIYREPRVCDTSIHRHSFSTFHPVLSVISYSTFHLFRPSKLMKIDGNESPSMRAPNT